MYFARAGTAQEFSRWAKEFRAWVAGLSSEAYFIRCTNKPIEVYEFSGVRR